MRYHRQELIIGKEGQDCIRKSHAVIVGMGALGTVTAELLVRAGIGKITIIDRDVIEESNLQRQSLYFTEDIGKCKADTAKERLHAMNPDVIIEAHVKDLDYDTTELLRGNIILDGTDNMYTRFVINDFAKKEHIPYIFCAAIGTEGMTLTVKERCLRCFLEDPTEPLGTCDTMGVLNPIIHLMASLQVQEAINIVTKKEPRKTLLKYNLRTYEQHEITIPQNNTCKTCQGVYEYLEGNKQQPLVRICGMKSYQIKQKEKYDLKVLYTKLETIEKGALMPHALQWRNMTIFDDGRVLVKTDSPEEAKSIITKYLE